MILQITAGIGAPKECQFAVYNVFKQLEKEYEDIRLVTYKEINKHCWNSCVFTSERDLHNLLGTIQCIFNSPFRPHHKRKNWFISISEIPEKEIISNDEDYNIQTLHSSGKGGQNVNKVETGVRVTHIATGLVVVCTEERSQYANKKKAIKRLESILESKNKEASNKQINDAWTEHSTLVRGNAIRVYNGINFKLNK